MRLTETMVRVLTKYNYFQLVEWSQVKCIKNKFTGRINCFPFSLFIEYKLTNSGEVRSFKFLSQNCFPTFLDLNLVCRTTHAIKIKKRNRYPASLRVIRIGFEPMTLSLEG